MRPADSVLPTPADHRIRLLDGMAQVIAEKGYADATIADIVAAAAVSRRTFYEHFEGKPECLIALYETASHASLRVLRDAVDPARPWQDQVQRALDAYLGAIAENPLLIRTLLIEILNLGLPGLAARRRVHGEIAAFVRSIVNATGTGQAPLSRELALALVGGIHELVLERIEAGQAARIPALSGLATDLVLRVAAGR